MLLAGGVVAAIGRKARFDGCVTHPAVAEGVEAEYVDVSEALELEVESEPVSG